MNTHYTPKRKDTREGDNRGIHVAGRDYKEKIK
jgi:hypothetical protein